MSVTLNTIETPTQLEIFSDSGVNRQERRKSLKGIPVPLGRGGRQFYRIVDIADFLEDSEV